jgi:hypothetical protein
MAGSLKIQQWLARQRHAGDGPDRRAGAGVRVGDGGDLMSRWQTYTDAGRFFCNT